MGRRYTYKERIKSVIERMYVNNCNCDFIPSETIESAIRKPRERLIELIKPSAIKKKKRR